jgi:hypothetical protein
MKDFIKALNIFMKYLKDDSSFPFAAEHDIFYVLINQSDVSDDDIDSLDELGFFIDDDGDGFKYYI